MIINLWSTPRTGSVRYSLILKSAYPNSILITELFNRYHMDMYHKEENGKIFNLHEYENGFYYKSYFIKNKILTFEKVYEKRIRNIIDEENYLINLLDSLDLEQTYIFHNHVAPINPNILEKLTEMAVKNIYIYRKDKRQQLASYAIAYSTKQFALFNPQANSVGLVNDINKSVLENLVNRIKIWDSLTKNGEIVSYEDSLEISVPVPVYKQNVDHKTRLSENMLNIIEILAKEYENYNLIR